MNKRHLILALAALVTPAAAFANQDKLEKKAAEAPAAAGTVAPEQTLGKEDTTLFNRVNDTYRKSQKKLAPQT